MTVESNYMIAIAALSDWLKRLAPVFQPVRRKTKTNRTMYAWFFPALRASYMELLGIVIGSSRCLLLLWLVGVIALVLGFRQSFENRSNNSAFMFAISGKTNCKSLWKQKLKGCQSTSPGWKTSRWIWKIKKTNWQSYKCGKLLRTGSVSSFTESF